MKHWSESTRLDEGQKEAMQSIVDQVPPGIAQAGFEVLLSKLAQGPFRYLVYSEGNIVGHSNDADLIDYVEQETDMEVFDLEGNECLREVTGEDVGYDADEDKDEDEDD